MSALTKAISSPTPYTPTHHILPVSLGTTTPVSTSVTTSFASLKLAVNTSCRSHKWCLTGESVALYKYHKLSIQPDTDSQPRCLIFGQSALASRYVSWTPDNVNFHVKLYHTCGSGRRDVGSPHFSFGQTITGDRPSHDSQESR